MGPWHPTLLSVAEQILPLDATADLMPVDCSADRPTRLQSSTGICKRISETQH